MEGNQKEVHLQRNFHWAVPDGGQRWCNGVSTARQLCVSKEDLSWPSCILSKQRRDCGGAAEHFEPCLQLYAPFGYTYGQKNILPHSQCSIWKELIWSEMKETAGAANTTGIWVWLVKERRQNQSVSERRWASPPLAAERLEHTTDSACFVMKIETSLILKGDWPESRCGHWGLLMMIGCPPVVQIRPKNISFIPSAITENCVWTPK